MTDQTEEHIRRGLAAERLSNDPLMVEAFAVVASDLTGRWATSDAADLPGRERLYQQLQNLDAVRDHLRRVVATGKMAAAEVKRRTLLEKARDHLTGVRDFL
jgi:hypothetical protein